MICTSSSSNDMGFRIFLGKGIFIDKKTPDLLKPNVCFRDGFDEREREREREWEGGEGEGEGE